MPEELLTLDGPGSDPELAELTFIGNATVLLRVGGFTILTDPNFLHAGDHAALGGGLRSRRRRSPALAIADLPPLDVVVLSHHHGDHFDQVAARELDPDVPIVTTGHAARKLERQGFHRPVALKTWDACTVVRGSQRLRITALPARHGPVGIAALLPETMGSLLEVSGPTDVPYRLYQTGDTLVYAGLREIPRRHPDIDCALVHLGATRVLGLPLTMDAEEGITLLRIVAPKHAVPIHIDDYTVQRMTLDDLTRALKRAKALLTQVHLVDRGQPRRLPGLGSAPASPPP